MALRNSTYNLVVIGGSSGALKALAVVLPALQPPFNMSIAIVLHRLASGASELLSLLQSMTPLTVKEPLDKEPIETGCIYLAAANYHLMVEHHQCFSYSYSEAVAYSRPSIDVLFETAAEAYQKRLIGIVLSGANADGTRGMQRIKQLGGEVWAQQPREAQAATMPQSIIEHVTPHKVLTTAQIAQHLNEISHGK